MREHLAVTDSIADWGLIFAFAGVVVFTVSYWRFFNWRKTLAGKSLMYVCFSFTAVAQLSLLGRWFGPHYWGREILRPVVWWSVAITVSRLVYVLWSSWRVSEAIDIESRQRKDKTDA